MVESVVSDQVRSQAFDTAESQRIRAVIVGIDHYDSKATSNLSSACEDASAMLRHLVFLNARISVSLSPEVL